MGGTPPCNLRCSVYLDIVRHLIEEFDLTMKKRPLGIFMYVAVIFLTDKKSKLPTGY